MTYIMASGKMVLIDFFSKEVYYSWKYLGKDNQERWDFWII